MEVTVSVPEAKFTGFSNCLREMGVDFLVMPRTSGSVAAAAASTRGDAYLNGSRRKRVDNVESTPVATSPVRRSRSPKRQRVSSLASSSALGHAPPLPLSDGSGSPLACAAAASALDGAVERSASPIPLPPPWPAHAIMGPRSNCFLVSFRSTEQVSTLARPTCFASTLIGCVIHTLAAVSRQAVVVKPKGVQQDKCKYESEHPSLPENQNQTRPSVASSGAFSPTNRLHSTCLLSACFSARRRAVRGLFPEHLPRRDLHRHGYGGRRGRRERFGRRSKHRGGDRGWLDGTRYLGL